MSRTRGSLLLVGARMLNAGFNLISVPIFLAVLGEAQYGAVLFALMVQGVLTLADFGSGEVIQRQMSTALSQDDSDEVWEINRDQLGINLITGTFLLLIGIVLGLTVSLDQGGIDRLETLVIFAAFGLQAMLGRMTQGLSIVLGTFRRFDSLSLAWTCGGFCVTALSLLGVWVTRRAAAYPVATVLAELVMMALMSRFARTIPQWRIPKPAFRWQRIKPLMRYFALEYPNRVAAFLPGVADKFLLGTTRNFVDLTSYRNAARLPDVLREMLAPLASTSLPALSGEFQSDPERFRRNVLFSGATVFFAASLAMIVPTGFATPLLRLWLGDFTPASGETIMIWVGLSQALQLYIMFLGLSLFAAGKRQLFIPVSGGGALLTIGLTLPLYKAFGIVGLAYMNAGISVLQCFGAWMLLPRIGFTLADLGKQIAQVAAILLVTGVAVACGALLSRTPSLIAYPSLSLALAPCFMLASFILLASTRLAPIPDRLARRIPWLRRRILP